MNAWRLVVGSDDAEYEYKQRIKADLQANPGVAHVVDVGVDSGGHTPYPTVALQAAEMVARGEADRAILLCGTGLGARRLAREWLGHSFDTTGPSHAKLAEIDTYEARRPGP
ncbi:RpiB/LacA/LacB family sugar-phosphate isomerase [Streptomyces paludis]|uniref:RpiB/LacA/LacB family sugar-phosphate isomerase n=1 Tax=Streptomyces paludis TaxID=2282738 RepID=A0A345HYT5_9ACTN|nr:RpiB/LacA/LacB family sugar-phosphate isomerase [Streptomyces paludis]AXG81859.1 RpiB/LacA/LacB family sugar-phosphate isomerase [Streptomyces paludis]